jgi:MerR family transcriptional regulator/heat shock protein HspR
MTHAGGAGPSRHSRVHTDVPTMDSAAPLYTVSQVAALLNVQPAFVRRLDREGVVIPARTTGRQRRYSTENMHHIAALVVLIADGATLADAQRVIELENEVAHLRQQLDNATKSPPKPNAARE